MTNPLPGVPEAPTAGEIMRGIGRLEESTKDIGGKIDRLDEKLDGHAGLLARHDERIGALERAGQRTWERVSVWIAVIAAIVAALVPHPWK
jgi:hypothetical protein